MVLNLTPHPLDIWVGEQCAVTIPPEAVAARIDDAVTSSEVIDIDGVPVPLHTVIAGDVTGLPHPVAGTWLIVSRPVAQAVGRPDLLVPGDPVRRDGTVVGCRGLLRISARPPA